MSGLALRPYQVDVIAELRRTIAGGDRRVLLVAPTGSGKTIIASAVVANAIAKGRRVLFLAHQRELIQQAAGKLWEAAGVDAGIVMAGFETRPGQAVQVASIPTFWHRAFRGRTMDKPEADLVVVDEAHHARARTYEQIVAAYPDACILGLTATPCRGDGRGLGNCFDALVECPSVQELIDLGVLNVWGWAA